MNHGIIAAMKARPAGTTVEPGSDAPRLTHLRGGTAVYLPGDEFGPRTLSDFEFVWVLTGSANYEHDGRTEHVPAGGVVLGRPGFREQYRWDRRTTTRHAFLHFDFDRPAVGWPPRDQWPVVQAMPAGDALRPLLRHVLDTWFRRRSYLPMPAPPWVDRALVAMVDLYLGMATASAEPVESPQPVQRALDYLHATLRQRSHAAVDLHEVAAAAKVNASHLNRLFRRALGLTPMRVVQLMRLEQALTLLERSNLSIKQVAERCGFASQFHFSRAFRAAYGTPPSDLRDQLHAGAARPPSPLPVDAPPIELG